MRDSARVAIPQGETRPVAYITTRAGTALHFKDAGQLADWLAARPGFPHQDIYEQFLEALDAAGVKPATGGSVDDALALVASFAAAKRKKDGEAA